METRSRRQKLEKKGYVMVDYRKEGEEDKGLSKLALEVAKGNLTNPNVFQAKEGMVGEDYVPVQNLTLFYALPTEKYKKSNPERSAFVYTGKCEDSSGAQWDMPLFF